MDDVKWLLCLSIFSELNPSKVLQVIELKGLQSGICSAQRWVRYTCQRRHTLEAMLQSKNRCGVLFHLRI
jgi:hypothetical protein